MTKLLLRLFIKDRENIKSLKVHAAIGALAGFTGILCNSLLFLGKLLVGLMIGSVSVIADAVNNLSDAASSVVTLLGFRLAQRPADADHPYGHARYEYLSALVVAALILVLGVELGKSSVEKLINPQSMTVSSVSLWILAGAIAVKLWMWRFFTALGKKIDSQVLLASGVDNRNDCVATGAVLAGCLLSRFFSIQIDGWLGLGVALFILWSGIGIARQTISPLLGKQADAQLVQKIQELVLSHEKVLGVHDLLVHDYGPGRCFATVHAELSAGEDPLVSHDLIDHIETDVLRELNVNLVIHYDPVVEGDQEWDTLRKTVEQVVKEINPRLSVHDFRMLRVGHQTKLAFDLAVPYDLESRELKDTVNAALAEQNIPYGTVIRFDGTV